MNLITLLPTKHINSFILLSQKDRIIFLFFITEQLHFQVMLTFKDWVHLEYALEFYLLFPIPENLT